MTRKAFAFVTPEALSRALLPDTMGFTQKMAILDVRSKKEFDRGHILGARNIPSDVLTKIPSLADLHARLQETGFEPIPDWMGLVIHCRLSLVRGPDSATHICRLVDRAASVSALKDMHQREIIALWTRLPVFLLEGGFKSWERLYASDQRLSVMTCTTQ